MSHSVALAALALYKGAAPPGYNARMTQPTARLKDVLVIGVGSIGHRHLRCFLQTGRVRAAICEVNRALADPLAVQYGVERVYSSLDEAP